MNTEHHMGRMDRSAILSPHTILDVVWAHRAYGYSPEETLCACDRTWRRHADHIIHVANAVRAHVAAGGVL